MRIGTWNVERGQGRAKNTGRLGIITEVACDVWILTETSDHLWLEGYTPVQSASRNHPSKRERAVTIWSRYPVKEELAVDDPARNAAALLDAPTGELLVFGTIIPWAAYKGANSERPLARWQGHHEAIPRRSAEWRYLREAYPQASFCVAGDLNMNLGGPHYYGTRLGRTLMRRAMSECGLECVTSWDCVGDSLQFGLIDHVILDSDRSPHAQIAGVWDGVRNGIRLSDHRGVAVEVLR